MPQKRSAKLQLIFDFWYFHNVKNDYSGEKLLDFNTFNQIIIVSLRQIMAEKKFNH